MFETCIMFFLCNCCFYFY